MLLNSRQFRILKNYRNVNVKSSAKREYRDENVFLKGDRALSKLITLLISNKKEFNHFFKSRSSDIVLLKLGNLNQNAKRCEARNTEREARRPSCECASEASRFFILCLLYSILFPICNYVSPSTRISFYSIIFMFYIRTVENEFTLKLISILSLYCIAIVN